jgi:hypothetical protein
MRVILESSFFFNFAFDISISHFYVVIQKVGNDSPLLKRCRILSCTSSTPVLLCYNLGFKFK